MALLCHSYPVFADDNPWAVFDDATLERLATDLQAGRDAQGLVETQRSEIAAKNEHIRELIATIDQLKQEANSRALAMALSEDREKRRAQNEEALLKVLQEQRKLIEVAMNRIESLERRQFWLMILGPIGLLIGVLAR